MDKLSEILLGYLADKALGKLEEEFLKKIKAMINAKENEIKARRQINDELERHLKVFDELEKKDNLNLKEAEERRNSLRYLSVKAPSVAINFKKWKNGEINYDEYLKIKNEKKEELEISNIILTSQEKYAEYNNSLTRFSKLKSYLEEGGILSLMHKYENGNLTAKEELDFNEKYVELKKLENEVIQDNFREWYSAKEKAEKTIKDLLNNEKLFEKSNDKSVDNISKQEKETINFVAPIEIKQEENKTKKILDNKKPNHSTKEPIIDLVAEEKYKQEELKINADYNKKILEETQDFNEKMKELLKSGNINEIQEVKKNHEENLKMFEEENKEALLKQQKNKPGATKIDIENLDTKIKMLKVEAEKEKNINKINQIEIEIKASEEAKLSNVNNAGIGLKNLSSMFQMLGEVTGKQSIKDISNVLGTGSSLFEAFKNTSIGAEKLAGFFGDKAIPGFENFNQGMGIGNIISGALGGGTEGNLGSMIGSGIGTAVGGLPGSIVGGAIGSIGGSLFGSKSKKKKKREERKRKAAQERLQRGLISGQYKWQDVMEAYNEDLLKLGAGSYIGLYDKVSANTDYDNVLSSLNGAKSGSDGVSMTTLKQLMPQYNEQQIIDWFKSLTGGAVLKGDILSTGEGKYGAIDIGELAKQVTNANRDLEKTLKATIKGIINFSADSLAAVVKKGFFGGMEDLGNDIEGMLAESLKNAFVNTEISKALFNGMSDKVSDVVKEMFVKDSNLGIDLETGDLENLSLTQYMELIKKYTEISNEKLEELFRELGLNVDNLTGSMNNLNKNMSKNAVQGMSTNLWKYNLGQKVTSEFNGIFEIEIPITLGDQLLDKRIIKITSDSIRKARRNKF